MLKQLVLHKQRGKKKASDLLLRCLMAHGVNTIYGLPGEENADVMVSMKSTHIDFIT